MRINKFLAQATGLSRRAADLAIASGQIMVNGQTAVTGQAVIPGDNVSYQGTMYQVPTEADTPLQTIMFHKPAGYVVSRSGQGSKTIYDLLPSTYHQLKPVGRLDKDSSGLLLLTNDGDLANRLTHPRYGKTKIYEVTLDKDLSPLHRQMIGDYGLQLEDGPSRLQLDRLIEGSDRQWRVTMHEGRNRQIRRTFAALGYEVVRLHRVQFGNFKLEKLKSGASRSINP
jgi:23S rRNA pseudouridine2605 synthase